MGSRLDKNSNDVSKRIQGHTFSDEGGEEYGASSFGGFSDYMRRKKIKLQNLDAELRSQSTDKPKIFRGIVVHVNGYTQPSLSDLHTLIVSHGGGFLQYLDGKTACTHIVASQLTPKKKAEFARYRIVKPAWIVDSVNAGRLLPWDGYRVVDEGVTQKTLGFENGNIVSQTNNQRQSYRAQTDTSWYTSHLKGLAQDLNDTAEDGQPSEQAGDSGNDLQLPGSSLVLPGDDDVFDHFDEDASLISPANGPPEAKLLTSKISKIFEASNRADGSPLDESIVADSLQSHRETTKLDMTRPESTKSDEKRQLTAEEHNAILLQNPHLAKSSTANPDFINQYYRESRLHHLSTWKAELKAQLQARTIEKSASQKSKQDRLPGTRRYIMHVDFDSFFAAVSLRKNPHLIDKPVVIAHGSGPGSEIASCNYPARKYGVKNGMWMKNALQLCSELKVLPYDFKAYEEASRHFYDSILGVDGIVQSISIDEALIDVSEQCIKVGGSNGKDMAEASVYREQSRADELAQALRSTVKEKTGCDVSVGIGGNILLAKTALRKAKPAGQHQIKPDDVLDFIGELTVTDLPGVAYSLGNKLEELGVKLVKDIRGLTRERLMNVLGPKTGEKLWDYSRGIDKAEVGDQVVRKSVSAEVNWGIRFITQQQAEEFVQCLCDELHRRLLENGVKGRQMTMKIMRKAADAGMDPPKNLGHGKCDTFNKSIVLGVSTNDKNILGKEAISILRGYGFSPGELRGLGVQMQKLEPIKAITTAQSIAVDSSQRRLQFKKFEKTATPQHDSTKIQQMQSAAPAASERATEVVESIEDEPVPHESKVSPAVQGAIESTSREDDRPLNIVGTQFMLPSQIDPEVLAELPADIRSKLAPKQKSIMDDFGRSVSPMPVAPSRSASPYVSDIEFGLPSRSQLDPETLAALPDDVRDELMAHYQNTSKSSALTRNQQLLPQSPRKGRQIPASKKTHLTPTKRQKVSSILHKGRTRTKESNGSTLTQSNFISMAKSGHAKPVPDDNYDVELSKSFLEELPEDIRLELLAEQKRNRMKAKSGLNVGTNRRRNRFEKAKADLPKGQQRLQLPEHAQKPTFTSRKLSTLPELREAMSAWVQEYSGAGEDGPFEEDATALGQYLQRVIIDEGDLSKAASIIEWLAYLVSDWPFDRNSIRSNWLKVISLLTDMVQGAVAERGLPPLTLNLN